jgi:hypothetical protein
MLFDRVSTLADVTSVWISILILWFPVEEEYQLRIKPNTNWIEIYVMRVAQRPGDGVVSFTPVFVIRCYGENEIFTEPHAWDVALEEIPSSVRRTCRSVDAHGFPAYGAVACGWNVRLCEIDPSAAVTLIYRHGSESSFAVVLNGGFEPYLDHIKADFVRAWNNIEMELQSAEIIASQNVPQQPA